jgi:hypothetical protein
MLACARRISFGPAPYNGPAGPPELASARRWPALSCSGKFFPSSNIGGCSPGWSWSALTQTNLRVRCSHRAAQVHPHWRG